MGAEVAQFSQPQVQTDQRGQSRTIGAACDLGAYEVLPNRIVENRFDP